MDPFMRQNFSGAIARIWAAAQANKSKASKLAQKAVLPLFGAAAAAPLIGYQADKWRGYSPPKPPEEDMLDKAAAAVQDSFRPLYAVKLADLNSLKLQIDQAKQRAKTRGNTPSASFTQGAVRDNESGDPKQSVSANPSLRS